LIAEQNAGGNGGTNRDQLMDTVTKIMNEYNDASKAVIQSTGR
jgi:hypothetical protein